MPMSGSPTFPARSTTRNIHLTSTVYFDTVHSYREALKGMTAATGQSVEGSENNYGIEGNPSLHQLQIAVARREDSRFAYLYCTGLAAIAAALDCFLTPGDHALFPDGVYEPTRAYCDYLDKNKSIGVSYYDSGDAEGLAKLVTPRTKVIYIESPASNTFELTDCAAVVGLASQNHILTIADNTWGSLTLSRPLAHGIDVSITALTKYAAGYGDVFMGSICLNDEILNERLRMHHNVTGAYASPFDTTLVNRGLESLDVRLAQHGSNVHELCGFLKQIPHLRIYRADTDTKTFQRYFSNINGLFSVELDRVYTDAELEVFVQTLQIFRLGESWGGTQSLVLIYQPDYFRDRKHAPTPANTVIRIHSGLEPIEEQITDLKAAFEALLKMPL